ncbi:MAG: HEAT repeat domain-containing protein, partial [Phycisphaeraceae bacterium]|nr:HEAT repeat domain-containing protein [Phycisphaeraceae bacterium]
ILLDLPGDFDSLTPEQKLEQQRVGRILGGGVVTEDSSLRLIANRDDHIRTAAIANRINVRFPMDVADKFPAANALDGSVIELNILKRYTDNPQRQLDLINHLYLQSGPRFNNPQARRLAKALAEPSNFRYVGNISLAWEGMGKTVLPILQELYDHPNTIVRLAALQAGARLGHPRTAKYLSEIARGRHDPSLRKLLTERIAYMQQTVERRNTRLRRLGGATTRSVSRMSDEEKTRFISDQISAMRQTATTLLGELLANRPDHFQARRMLRLLLNHTHTPIRLSAFRALAQLEDRTIGGFWFKDKLELAYVNLEMAVGNSQEPIVPMIWAAQTGTPRLIVFGHKLEVQRPILFDMWDDKLIIKAEAGDPKLSIYYRLPGARRALKEKIEPTAVHLIGKMAFNTNEKGSEVGLNFSYSQILQVLKRLTDRRDGAYVAAPLVVEKSDLAEGLRYRIRRFDRTDEFRPGFRTGSGQERTPELSNSNDTATR